MSNNITPQSTTATGTPGNGLSLAPAASPNGLWLTFASDATNLSTPDAGGLSLVYLKNTQTGTLIPIGLPSIGGLPSSNSTAPDLSDDGRYVVFQSWAANLTQDTHDQNGVSDIFWKDTQTSTLKLLSRATTNGKAGDAASILPVLSADGRYVAFQSRASNFVNYDSNGAYDIYLADVQTATLMPVSRNAQNAMGNKGSYSPSISTDGQVVAFSSDATNLVTGDNNLNRDVFVKNLQTGDITLISTDAQGQAARGHSDHPALSADGKQVAFVSSAPAVGNTVFNDNNYFGYNEVYVENLASRTLMLASADASGQAANSNSWSPVLSRDGRYLVFVSDATNLVSGDTNELADVFVKETNTGKIARINADSLGGQLYRGEELNKAVDISADGQWIFFSATSSTSNGAVQVFKAENPLLSSGDTVPPIVNSFNPADEATGVGISTNIVLTFNEPIQRGSGNIVLKTVSGTVITTYDAASSSNLSLSGSVLTLNPTADLAANTAYTIVFPEGSVKDLAGNNYVGTSTYNFTTSGTSPPVDTVPPVVSSFNPADEATGVAVAANIVLTFNEPIQRGSGNIVLKTVSGTVITTYDAGSSNNLSLSGSVLTLNPTADLAANTAYTIVFPEGSVKDLAGNNYVGTSTYNFTTAATISPPSSYNVPGTLGRDAFLPTAGNRYMGGGGDDTYVISPMTLSGAVTAQLIDTEGQDVIQLVDGVTIAASSFFSNATQLTLSNDAKIQILGASHFSYQVGANAPAGDSANSQTYSQFAVTLGGSIPTGSTSTAGTVNYLVPTGFVQAPLPTPATPGAVYNVPGTPSGDAFVPTAGNRYMGGGGDDTYVISPMTLSGAVTAQIVDTEGHDVIQLVDGMTIASSSFFNNAVQLTLSNDAKIQILGASHFSYQVGANAPAGDSADSQTYAQFGTTLDVNLPAPGASAVSGRPNFVVPSNGSGFTVVDLNSGTVTASPAAEAFRYDFSLVNGRGTRAGDGDVTINNFDTAKDKLVFVNTTNSTVYTEAQFIQLPGVSISGDVFNDATLIYFDPRDGLPGGVRLTGIVDAPLAQIVVETTSV